MTAHNPRIKACIVHPDDRLEGFFNVEPVWEADIPLDRPSTRSWVVRGNKLATRLQRAVEAGAVFEDATVETDIDGNTYVQARSKILARMANADLKRLGY